MSLQTAGVGESLALGDINPRSAVHVLNRLGYGPRPGDVDRVLNKGIDRYVDEQLDPGRDPDLDRRLSAFPNLNWTVGETWSRFQTDIQTSRPEFMGPRTTHIPTLIQHLHSSQIVRAAHSQNQLLEKMTWFWFNHFNVNLNDDYVRYSAHDYEKQLRQHALGRFRDVLMASAHHPAMMSYLDNYLSTISRFDRNGRLLTGLNENYGRELLELHTVGVDADYTQDDVYNAAVVLTGWGFDRPRGTFLFTPANHDPRAVNVFGYAVPAGLMQESGEGLLGYLSRHPKTAQHVCTKLVRYFVSDDPPPALVARAAATFLATDGDIREVLRVIFESSEFWAAAVGSPKYADPFQYVIGVLRALDADVTDPNPIRGILGTMGQPQYACIPPTGWSDLGREWANPSANLARINFVLGLVSNAKLANGQRRYPGVAIDVDRVLTAHRVPPDDVSPIADFFNHEIFGNRLSATTLSAVRGLRPTTGIPRSHKVAGLLLAGPEGQGR